MTIIARCNVCGKEMVNSQYLWDDGIVCEDHQVWAINEMARARRAAGERTMRRVVATDAFEAEFMARLDAIIL